jgi:hypothetical protein
VWYVLDLRFAVRILLLFSFVTVGSFDGAHGADCIPFTDAGKHVGTTQCVRGKVLRVKQGNRGAHFFDYCEDYRTCPFTVIVFAGDLKQVGDVRQLAGREIDIRGHIKDYDGRAEIILERPSQLLGDSARIPPVPKEYDVERKGKFSAGTFSHASPPKKPPRKRQPAPVSTEDPNTPLSPSD